MKQPDRDILLSPVEQRMGALLREEPAGECLSLDELIVLVERRRRAPRYHEAIRHLLRCKECRQTYHELKALRAVPRQQLNARSPLVSWRTPLQWATPAAAVGILLVWLRLFISQPTVAPKLIAGEEPTTQVVSASPTPQSRPAQATPYIAFEPRTQKPSALFQESENTNSTGAFETRLAQELEAALRKTHLRLHRAIREASKQAIGWSMLSSTTRSAGNSTASKSALIDESESALIDESVRVRIVSPESIGKNSAVEPSQGVILEIEQVNPTDENAVVVRLVKETAAVSFNETFPLTEAVLRVEIPISATDPEKYVLTVEPAHRPNYVHARYSFRFLSKTPYPDGLNDFQKIELANSIKDDAPLLAAQILYDIGREGDVLDILHKVYQDQPELSEVGTWIQVLEAKQQRLQVPKPPIP